MQKTYLIIGGAGFIGVNVADHFLNKGERVIVFDNLSRKGTDKNLAWLTEKYQAAGNLEFAQGDICKGDDLPGLTGLMEKVDYVLHLAAQVAVTTSVTDPRHDFENNVLGTFNVLECLRASKRRPSLIYASTNKVYGGLEDVPVVEEEKRYRFENIQGVPETQNLDFHSPYGCSKGAADQYVRDYARIYGLKTVVCRQSCIYGPHQFGIEDQGWVAWFMIATTMGKPITIYGNGKQVRDILHSADLVELYDRIFENMDQVSGQIFNVGGGPKNTLSLREFIDFLEQKTGAPLKYAHGDTRPGDQPIYISDISLLKEKLGWEPKISVQDGCSQLWNWIQGNKNLF